MGKVQTSEFRLGEIGMAPTQAIREETPSELSQFQRLAESLVGGHSPEDLQIPGIIRMGLGVHRLGTGRSTPICYLVH
jgi:hypothetical protein